MPRYYLLSLFLALVISLPALSQETSPGDRDLIRDRQERILEEQRRRLEELQQLPGQAAPTPRLEQPADSACFPVRHIRLSGAGLMPPERQRELLAGFEGRCLGTGELNQLLKEITDFYLDRGHVTSRAYLPQQDLADGELEVIVIEGRLEGLDGSAIASDRELAMVSPARIGEVLDLRELEQLVDQINRLPSRPAQLELVPGAEVGGSRVRLQGEPDKPWRAGLNRHNDGQRDTGEQQWGVNFDWDSPLGLADQLSLRGGGDLASDRWRHSANQGFSYSLPYGWWSLSYAYSQSYYRTRNDSSGFAFVTDGESKSHQFQAERVLHRDAVSKTAASFGLSHLRTRNYMDNSLIGVSSHRLSEALLGFNHGRRIGAAFVNLDAGWHQGVGALDAQGAGHPRGSEPVARYDKYSLTLSFLLPFQVRGENLSFDSLAYGQRSEDVLFSPQRISLGGLSSVRGFKDQSLSGDSGGYWRNQLRWRRAIGWEPLRPWLQEYGVALAYDLGVIHGNRHNPGQHGRMSGHALELSARGQHLAASVTFARSLERPAAIERREHPLYFRFDLFF
ncbi:ShlB/FhaC/HecB family hemolysin secretion/activation protein [Metapseudomonas resinovorans]|uniref:Putative hemolysin activation/secretion protein n=1 Tax=Metapseudomonas resinovorans NBRC 106553 TaxID=1245471 RepID=S6BPX9_METRE|nr:ShlB/FhaC/HecB family hemolysin secretion/activation protein [Pseudomonas resinovorans]BAN51064.1 putative hemolysin activation/secretion protein [Pseudomonas resinovorans NBRC 106553]